MSELTWETLSEDFFNALAKPCQFLTDDSEWIPAYFVGVNRYDDGSGYIEVLPRRDTPYGEKWYEENKPRFNFFPDVIKDPQPAPIKVTDLKRVRVSL